MPKNTMAVRMAAAILLMLSVVMYAAAAQNKNAPRSKKPAVADCSDEAITAKVTEKLSNDSRIVIRELYVETHKGVVKLSGACACAQMKRIAAQVTKTTRCVKRVTNGIKVEQDPGCPPNSYTCQGRCIACSSACGLPKKPGAKP